MNLQNYYYYFKSAIPHKTCDEIVKFGKEQKEKEEIALTGGLGLGRDIKKNPLNKKEIKDLKKIRQSNIVWMSEEWIYNQIQPFVKEANIKAGWNFDWDWSEACQFTIYKKGQFYDWHCDSWPKPYTDKGPTEGKIRKLSVTVNLVDSTEYTGGELEFDFKNLAKTKKSKKTICKEILEKGSLVVFPSFVWHRVNPVKKGTRYSLVMWNLGYPFK